MQPISKTARTASAVALLTTAALALSGCFPIPPTGPTDSEGPGGSAGYRNSEIEVNVLYAAGESGGVATQRISVEPSEDGDLSIDISEDEVSGVGAMTQAASWNSVSVATLLTGAPLDVAYRFAFDGKIDGPSAGALTTIGLLALYYGHEISPEATMTGTINPMGTVGTVGGIPEKIQGVIDAGDITTVLIPAGQRNAPDAAGEMVDVVRLGESGGVDVVEVTTLYEAYPLLTGEELQRPADVGDPEVDDDGYTKFKSAGDTMLASYDRALADFATLDPLVQSAAVGLPEQAAGYAERARSLQNQALQGGAFFEASQASLLMGATASTYRTLQDLIVSQGDAISARLSGAATIESEFLAFLDRLSTFEPKTIADAEALITAYGNAFDAYTLLKYATASLQQIADTIAAAAYTTPEQVLQDALMPLIYYDFARGSLTFASAIFDVGRDNGGEALEVEQEELDAVASFFRRAADADWAAFESGVIQPAAESRGQSNEVFRGALSAIDTDVALSYTAQQSVAEIEQYLSSGDNAAYATMGYGYVNYARNAVLIEKYYNNGVLDENLQIVGVTSETILTAALDLGREQTARGIGVLVAAGANPVVTTGAYEQAGVAREGDTAQKFQAIAQYSGAFVLSRILAYVGGFPREGYSAAEE